MRTAFGGQTKIPKSALPLHLKAHVKPMDLEALECLPNKTPACRKFLLEALRWIRDPHHIGRVTLQPKRPRFSKKHFEEMKGYKYKPLVGLPEGYVDSFVRAEPSKDPNHVHGLRLRPLFAADANHEGASRDRLQMMKMPTKGEIRVQGADQPELVIQFDKLSYYDQFELSEGVKRKMCFHGPDGVVYALERLPMGLRPACEVAQATTWFLLDFPRSDRVRIATCIDNVRFVGPTEEVVEAVRTYLERCRVAGVQLDRWPKSDSTEDIIAMGERAGDFLGEHYDYDRSKRKLTKKSVKKVEMLQKWYEEQHPTTLILTARQMSVMMGLLFWTASVLNIPLAGYFHLMREYRRLAAKASLSAQYDETAAILTMTARRELEEWLRVATSNEEVDMTPRREGSPSLTLVVDASAAGYGCIATTDFTECQVYGGQWRSDQRKDAQSSVWAEPEGIYLSCLRFVRPTDKHVKVFTDHSPVVDAAKAGYARGFSPNLLLLRLRRMFPQTTFEIVHVRGINNPADRISRIGEVMGGSEKELNESEKVMLAALAPAEGMRIPLDARQKDNDSLCS